MGETISLTAEDGHTLEAYRAEPARERRGGRAVRMRVFGLALALVCAAGVASAHEVRPGLLEITERPGGRYDVVLALDVSQATGATPASGGRPARPGTATAKSQ